jgi:hypothetical protein
MKVITINRKDYALTGIARTLISERVDRAAKNSARPNFNEKFTHPRSLRTHASQRP